MTTSTAKNSQIPSLVADDISQYAYKSWDELFSLPREEVEAFQLRSARRRFEELAPQVAMLKDQADQNGARRVETLNDLVPLLFSHTVFKSYPISLLENNRFDQLTRWFQRATTIDLSGVDMSQCKGIDDWLETLERATPLQIYHTSGTTGKFSFIPRTTLEHTLFSQANLNACGGGFGAEPSVTLGGPKGIRLPVVQPYHRYGRYTANRMLGYLAEHVAPTPDQCYTLNGTLSADLVSLSGRIRIAQAKGEVAKMKISADKRQALKAYLDETARRPQEMIEFFERTVDKLRGQRVLLLCASSFLHEAAATGLARGISDVFAPDSVVITGGGGKDVVLPDGWSETVKKFTGIPRWKTNYGMTEISSLMPNCPHGQHHIHPHIVPFLLDPETDAVLPREGTQTGRFAGLDLLAQTYWGGVISGDKVTIEWDSACPCARVRSFTAISNATPPT
jgi:hypothetical protein